MPQYRTPTLRMDSLKKNLKSKLGQEREKPYDMESIDEGDETKVKRIPLKLTPFSSSKGAKSIDGDKKKASDDVSLDKFKKMDNVKKAEETIRFNIKKFKEAETPEQKKYFKDALRQAKDAYLEIMERQKGQ